MVAMELELYHPSVGTATIRDTLPISFPAKVKAFWMALNDLSPEQIAGEPNVAIEPEELVGAQFIVQLGEQENKQTGKVYKSIVAPWYYPLSRVDVLEYAMADAPI